ncbi:MAG: hypothetical protein ACKOJE_08395 [Bacteroidota bacterium]
MLVSFFKTPGHKKFSYKPLYVKEECKTAAKVGDTDPLEAKRIRFKRNTMVQAGSARHLGGLRFVGLFAAILGLSGVMVGDDEWRQISLALILFAGWVGWRLFRSSKGTKNPLDSNPGSHVGN